MLKLFHAINSVCSIKVRVALAEIGLPYEEVVLDLQAGDQQDPEYLKLNPDGVVPTLIDGDLLLVESSLILEYLDRVYNQSALLPKEPAAETTARHWLLRCIAIHDAINTMTFSTSMRDKVLAANSPEQIDAQLARMPNPVMRMKRKDLFEHGLASGYVDQAVVTLKRTLRDISAALAQTQWVSGPNFGISDIALLPYIDRLERLGFDGLWTENCEGVADWLAAMQKRPSYTAEVSGKMTADAASAIRNQGARYWPELRARYSSF